ncbi:MAG: tungstate transport system ATP-binding protein [Candidatus Azotimanducaceae bacterium]|jgi:tungstate transport system ATP-binding protein
MRRPIFYVVVPNDQLMPKPMIKSKRQSSSLLPLVVQNLSFRVGEKLLLDNINTTVSSTGVSVVLGANGAGKSLFVRLLHGLLKSEQQAIKWNGQTLDLAIRKRQALVFQKPVLLRRSVAANIDFVLTRFTLRRKTAHFIQQRNTVLHEAGLFDQRNQPARLLSGGEQQRLALARALATKPEVLILDEPTASLDAATTFQIETRLERARDKGIKIFLVTHDIAQARRLADDVMFMHGGRLIEHSGSNDFFNHPSSEQAKAYLEGRLLF